MGFVVVVVGFEIYFWVHLLLLNIVFCPCILIFPFLSVFFRMGYKTEKNFHVFYVSPNLSRLRIIKKGFPQKSERRKRKARERKITQIESFIHRCEADTKKSHASFNADRHKYHTIYL